jgi:DNA polymerase-1
MKLLAVDSNSILNRAYYGIRPLTTREGLFTNGIYGFLNIFFKLLDETKPDAVAFAFDLAAPTFRHEMSDTYKAQRKGMPEELAQQLEPLKEIIRLMGYSTSAIEGYEADDILGTLSKISTRRAGNASIATGDRDSFQLVRDCVFGEVVPTQKGGIRIGVY